MRPEVKYYSDNMPCLSESYDFVVIGSGLTAASFVHRLNSLCQNKRILVLEAGPIMSGQHFQQEGRQAAWDNFAAAADHEIGSGVPALVPHRVLFGGRTVFWTAWTPRPTERELDRWPSQLAVTLQGEFDEAEKFLGVEPAMDQGERFPLAGVEGYTIRKASIAWKNGVKFSAIGAWNAIFDGPANNTVRVVCNARVADLVFQGERVLGIKIGSTEKLYAGAQFVLCAGALENFRLGRKPNVQAIELACHGVVSHVVAGKLAKLPGQELAIHALLARPDNEVGTFDHHFQICLASFPPGSTPEDIHRASPDVLELSPALLEARHDVNFACSITCLFEFPSLATLDSSLEGFGLNSSLQLRGLESPDRFSQALANEFAHFDEKTKRFAQSFLTDRVLDTEIVQVDTTAKYVVHDTLLQADVAYNGIRSWRGIYPGYDCNAFFLGQVNWPAVGVSNPAILNVAAAFSLANELA